MTRLGYTLIEVMMASALLALVISGSMAVRLRLERYERQMALKMEALRVTSHTLHEACAEGPEAATWHGRQWRIDAADGGTRFHVQCEVRPTGDGDRRRVLVQTRWTEPGTRVERSVALVGWVAGSSHENRGERSDEASSSE